MSEEQKFPSEVIELPSEGKLYPKDSPLSSGKLEVKYMTAKEEDILTSQNLIKKGLVIDKLLDSLILTKNVTSGDLVLGDKNAVMVAARILAYGPEYNCEVTLDSGEKINHTFDLTDCPFKKCPEDVNENNFEVDLPASKKKIGFKILTGKEESQITKELDMIKKKVGSNVTPELTTRLKKVITSVDGESERNTINLFVDNMLSRDSIALRQKIAEVSPDINLEQEIEVEGETVRVDIPMTVNFFWPKTSG
tara:strand:- start:3837 stop:4589 length:753 start_codon:yes stop_codon:yes gene_type:complete